MPHLGANIPIGLQYAALFFAETGNLTAMENLRRINSEAARQLLIRHISKSYDGQNFFETNANCFRENLVTDLNNIGWPEQLRKVAIANGNLSANGNGITNGTQIILWNYSTSTWGNKALGYNFLAASCELFAQGRPDHKVFHGVYSNPTPNISFSLCFGIIYKVTVISTNGPINITIGNGGVPPVCLNILISRFQRIYNFDCGGVNCPNLDGAPGGMNDAVLSLYNQIASEATKLATVQPILHSSKGYSCFIPSISALALTNPPNFSASNYGYNIASNLNPNKPISTHTPFDAFKGPEGIYPNEGHVFIKNDDWYGIRGINSLSGYAGNMEWLALQIQKTDYNVGTFMPNANGNTYNYGNRFQRKIKTVHINNNGVVQVNGNYKTNFGNTTDENAEVNSMFTLYTAGCGTQVTIHSGGKFIIGDNNNIPNNNKALVYITAGSALRVRNGGELKIHANSKLIIQKGAQLIIENGAIINLIDANGALVIEGELKMEQNATFATIGNGYVHFKKTTTSTPLITCIGNNTIHIKGNSNSSTTNTAAPNLLVEGGELIIGDQLKLFKIENVKCDLVNNSGLVFWSNGIEVINSTFTSPSNSTIKNKGIRVNGNPLIQSFNDVKINNSEIGICGYLLNFGNELTLNNVRFYDCNIALKTVGSTVNWENGLAERCSTLWVCQAGNGSNYLKNVKAYRGTITQYGTGINFTGSSYSYLQILNSIIMGYDYNVRGYNVWIDLKCTNLLNSKISELYIENGEYSSSLPYNTGYNILKGLNWSINTFNSVVYLDEGFSSYNSDVLSLPRYGASTLSCAQQLTGNDVLANYNEWKLGPNFYGFELTCNDYYAGILDNNIINTSIQQYINSRDIFCGFNTVPGEGGGLGKTNETNNNTIIPNSITVNSDTSIILNSARFVNKTFSQAFQTTIVKLNSPDSLRNYYQIMNDFKDIINSNNLYLNRNERLIKTSSYNKLLHCFGNLVAKKQIVINNQNIDNKVLDVINLQNNILTRTSYDSTWLKYRFRIGFDKALIFQMIDRNTQALQLLDSLLTSNLDSNNIIQVNEWKCYINGEIALANKTVTNDSLKFYYPCYVHKPNPNLYLSLQKSDNTSNFQNITNLKNNNFKIFPNPAYDKLNIVCEGKDSKVFNIQVYDLLGKLIYEKNYNNGVTESNIDISNYNQGIYVLKLYSNKGEIVNKFIKE